MSSQPIPLNLCKGKKFYLLIDLILRHTQDATWKLGLSERLFIKIKNLADFVKATIQSETNFLSGRLFQLLETDVLTGGVLRKDIIIDIIQTLPITALSCVHKHRVPSFSFVSPVVLTYN